MLCRCLHTASLLSAAHSAPHSQSDVSSSFSSYGTLVRRPTPVYRQHLKPKIHQTVKS